MKILTRLMPFLAAVCWLTGCAVAPAPATLAQTLSSQPQWHTFTELVQSAGLIGTLAGPGPTTVFAPTDDAFRALPAATLQALRDDPVRLKSVMGYHLVPAAVASTDVRNGPVKTVQGTELSLYRSGTFLTADDALVTAADVRASNGVIHTVDKVLIPR